MDQLSSCIFCDFSSGTDTLNNAKSDIVYEDEKVIAFISPKRWLNNPGNVLVIPRAHFKNIYDISDDLLAYVVQTGKRVAQAMKAAYACDGITFRQNNESAGGQEVWHFHLHVFPRWNHDELYLNEDHTRFVPQAERAPYAEKLRAALAP